MRSHRKFLVSYICHIELIIYIRKFTVLNILGQIPQRKFLVSYICHIELIIYIRKFTVLNIFGQIPY